MKLLLLALLFSGSSHAAFDEDSLRYFSPWDFVYKLKDTFPTTGGAAKTKAKNPCSDLTSVAAEFGTSDPATGSPIANSPSPLAIRWIEVCTNALTKQSFAPDSTLWAKKSAPEQTKILNDLLHRILGEDEVIQSYGLLTNIPAFVEKARADFARQKLTGFQVKQRWALALVLRDEFLSY